MTAMGLMGLKILVVEDAADIREVFAVLLRAEGAHVVPAANGREALEALAHQTFDVILSDLGLPDVQGDALIRQMLATARNRVRVVVITGYGEPYLTRARQAGAEVVFIKPVEWTRVLDYLGHIGLAATA
jgi:two-component system CheB/CheR fusion protein